MTMSRKRSTPVRGESLPFMTIDRIVDTHIHFRGGEGGGGDDVVRFLVAQAINAGSDVFFGMPNLKEWLGTYEKVQKYLELCQSAVPDGQTATFQIMLALTENTSFEEIDRCVEAGQYHAKVYPLSRTTGSDSELGVRNYLKLMELIRYAGKKGMTVHFHPEYPWLGFHNRDAEYLFMPIVDMLLQETDATIVWEHGTDARCIPFWKEAAKSGRFAVTLTAHHLLAGEDHYFGDVSATCKPPVKTPRDCTDLKRLVAEDHAWVMAGSDSAPHDIGVKHPEAGRCACGAYTALFGEKGVLFAHCERSVKVFERFMGGNARLFHGLPPATGKITLVREPRTVPSSEQYSAGGWTMQPFAAGRTLEWRRDVA